MCYCAEVWKNELSSNEKVVDPLAFRMVFCHHNDSMDWHIVIMVVSCHYDHYHSFVEEEVGEEHRTNYNILFIDDLRLHGRRNDELSREKIWPQTIQTIAETNSNFCVK